MFPSNNHNNMLLFILIVNVNVLLFILTIFINMSSPAEQEGEISTPNVLKLSSDLRPLMFWMSNATELLNFFQVKVETMEKEWEFEGDLRQHIFLKEPTQTVS